MNPSPKPKLSRRRFLEAGAAGASVLALPSIVRSGVVGNDDVVKLCTVGCGGRGSNDLEALVKVPNIRITGVCELRPERLEKAKRIAGAFQPNGYADYRKMLETEKPDGVSVVVEVQNHAKVVVPVLEMGFNCFSEKPLDSTVEKVDQMVAAARKSKGFLQVGLQRRYIAGHQQIVERIHKEELGRVYALQGHWHFSHPAGPADADWDGGRLIEQACHHMDTMSWVMKSQAPLRCVSIGRPPLDPGKPSYPHMSEGGSATVFEFPGNVIYSYTHFFGASGPMGDEEGPTGSRQENAHFNGEKLWVLCERGGWDLTRGMKYTRGKGKEQAAKPSGGYYEGTDEQFVSFVDCIRNGKKPLSNHETARVSTLMSMLGRMAMYNREKRAFEPRVIEWKDLGSKTDLT